MEKRALIKIHYNCNNNCLFCHSHDYKKNIKFSSILEKIKEAQKLGVELIALSGGEPTIHKDILKIISEIKDRGMKHGFITNGRMFSYKEFLNKIISFGGEYFYISLHSHKKEIHDSITRSKNSWEQAIKGIRNIAIHKTKPELIVNCVVIKENIDNLKEISKILIETGVQKIKFSYPIIKGSMKENISSLVDINYCSKKISEAIEFCDQKKAKGMYENIPCCLIEKDFSLFYDGLKTNFYYVSESFEENLRRTNNDGKIYRKNKDCLKCSNQKLCPGYLPGYKIKPKPFL